jgi:hypothetical protein
LAFGGPLSEGGEGGGGGVDDEDDLEDGLSGSSGRPTCRILEQSQFVVHNLRSDSMNKIAKIIISYNFNILFKKSNQ